MQKVYIVRFGNGYNQPESYILGLYPTQALAEARIAELTSDDVDEGGWDPDEVWTDVVEVGPKGGACFLSNR